MTLRKRHTPIEIEEAWKEHHAHSIRALLPRLDWHALWKDEEEEEWLLYPLLPARRLIALFSAAKAGKSLLMLEIAAGLSSGKKVLGHDPGRRIRVLYIDFENDPRGDVRTRLQDMGYEPEDLDHLDYLSFPSLPYLDSEIGASALLAAVETYGPELVVIDTISRAVQGEENDNNTWLNLYKHTGLRLKQARVAMIRLDHTGKDEAKGQRGGSAKSGDVDAIWKLTTVVKDERYRLECIDKRFSLDTLELSLKRHDDPLLHHTVEDTGVAGGEREAKIQELIEKADRDNLPVETGARKFRAWMAERGLKARKDALEEAVRRRKNPLTSVPHLVKLPASNVPPGQNGGGNGLMSPQSPPGLNGNGQNPLSDVPPDEKGTSGDASTSKRPPLSLSIREGTGEGTGEAGDNGHRLDPDQPCKRCNRTLGLLVVQRGLDAHVACQREIDREEALRVKNGEAV